MYLWCFILQLPLKNKDKKEPTIPHINPETNPPPPIVNVVCYYLSLGTSFGAATLSRGKEPDLFLQSGPLQNFQKFFQELTWSQ